MFLCVHCPYVIHLKAGIAALAKEYQVGGFLPGRASHAAAHRLLPEPQGKNVGIVGISSNSVITHPEVLGAAVAGVACCMPPLWPTSGAGRPGEDAGGCLGI
jgi:hypothetical protein